MLTFLVSGKGIEASRYIYKEDGKLICENKKFMLDETGTGLGTSIFHDQAQFLSHIGVDHIKTQASGGVHLNGYNTWPRLGYDGNIPKYGIAKRPESLAGLSKISDLMKTQEGRDWWKQQRHTVDVTFDLKPGSPSLLILNEYMSRKEK